MTLFIMFIQIINDRCWILWRSVNVEQNYHYKKKSPWMFTTDAPHKHTDVFLWLSRFVFCFMFFLQGQVCVYECMVWYAVLFMPPSVCCTFSYSCVAGSNFLTYICFYTLLLSLTPGLDQASNRRPSCKLWRDYLAWYWWTFIKLRLCGAAKKSYH